MKKIGFALFIGLFFSVHVFAQAKSPLPTVSIKCPLFSQEEAKSIQDTCSLINDADFEQMYKDCQKSASQSGKCAAQSVGLDDLINELRISSAMRNYNDFAAGGATRSLDQIRTILNQLEKMKLQGNCAPQSLAFKLLPLASIINAPLTFAAASAAQILSRTYKLLSDEKNDYGTKFALCQANAYARESRSMACQQSLMAARDKSGLVQDISIFENRIKKGEKSKTFKILNELAHLSNTILMLEQTKDSKGIDADFISGSSRNIEEVSKILSCNDKKETFLKSFCTEIIEVQSLLQFKDFNWQQDTTKRREQLQKLARFASSNWYKKLHFALISEVITPEAGAYTSVSAPGSIYYYKPENVIPSEAKRILPRLDESVQSAYDGMLAYYNQSISEVTSPLSANISNLLSSKNSAEQMDLAIEAFPHNFNIEKNKTSCDVTACLWGKATSDSVAKNFKNLHEYGWDMVGAQSIATLTAAGSHYKAWKARLATKAKSLNKMIHSCQKMSQQTCNISCQINSERSKLNEMATPINYERTSDPQNSAR